MPTVLLHIENGIGTITLNRPEKLNAFHREMALLLQAKLDQCASLHEIRCVLLVGAGKGFCAGQDLGEVSGLEAGPRLDEILREHYHPIVRKIRNLSKPVVAAVNGVAAGAGANLALCCDIVVAAPSASFIQAFSKIGLIPDSAGTFILPRLVGWQRASALMLLGDRVSAAEALQMGMIYKIYAEEEFLKKSMEVAQTLSALPTQALALTKHALNFAFSHSLEEQLHLEAELQQQASESLDHQEAVRAFLQKRAPRFSGQ
jgi:2-(1,2-epoxy-1,2-dihydrophenyl)acetyl-CoA isomerase